MEDKQTFPTVHTEKEVEELSRACNRKGKKGKKKKKETI